MATTIARVASPGERFFRRRALLAGLAVLGLLAACAPPAHDRSAGEAAVGGPFHLVDQSGKAVDEGVLKGKWSLVFFGYTYCPEACPTTLTTLASALDQLGPNGTAVQVVFVSIDPERDTPAALKTYLSSPSFPKGVVGLTGTAAQVATAAKAYHVFYQKDGTGPSYAMDHSTIIYLMDPKGAFVKVIAYGLSPDEVAKQVSAAMRQA